MTGECYGPRAKIIFTGSVIWVRWELCGEYFENSHLFKPGVEASLGTEKTAIGGGMRGIDLIRVCRGHTGPQTGSREREKKEGQSGAGKLTARC